MRRKVAAALLGVLAAHCLSNVTDRVTDPRPLSRAVILAPVQPVQSLDGNFNPDVQLDTSQVQPADDDEEEDR